MDLVANKLLCGGHEVYDAQGRGEWMSVSPYRGGDDVDGGRQACHVMKSMAAKVNKNCVSILVVLINICFIKVRLRIAIT